MGGLAAEPGERGCAQALEVAAEGRKVEIDAQDVALAVAQLELEGAGGLAQLPDNPPVAPLQKTRRLHGQGRGAGDHPPIIRPLRQRPANRQRVDTWMVVEALVLIGDQHAPVERRHLGQTNRQPPGAALGDKGAQKAALAVDHDGAQILRLPQVRRKHPVEHRRDCEQVCTGDGQGAPRPHRQASNSRITPDAQRALCHPGRRPCRHPGWCVAGIA